MNPPVIDWSRPQRQSPAALVVLLFKALLNVLRYTWPLLFFIIIRKKSESTDSNNYETIALVVSLLSLLISVVEYYNFRFSIRNNELVVNQGIFIKKTIHLPFEKIQAIHTEQGWLHSFLNVSRISFDTAGSEKLEVKIEALDKIRARALKEFIAGHQKIVKVDQSSPLDPGEILITLSGKDLFKLSISANHLEAFFLLLAFVYTGLQNAGVSDQVYTGLLKKISDWLGVDGIRLTTILISFVLIISIGFSILRIVLVYADFRISKETNGYRIFSGLINKKEKYLPFRKIQFISWRANWLRKQIGMYLLRFHATGAERMKNKMKINVPITREAFIPLLTQSYHPLLIIPESKHIRIAKVFIWRRVLVFGLLPALPLLTLFGIYEGWVALFFILWPLFIFFHYWLFQKKFQLLPGEQALQLKKGKWGEHELIVKWQNIQSVQVEQGIYQRKHNLATLVLKTAAGSIHVPFIELNQAWVLGNYALYKIETSPW
jgi:putative membrane protein